jgi:hypothetical protein
MIDPRGNLIHDVPNDTQCVIPANAELYACTRLFSVGQELSPGMYGVIFGLWSGDPGLSSWYTPAEKRGWLVVWP